jgi:uridine kinase
MLIIELQVVQEETTVVHQIMNELPQTEVGIISQDSITKKIMDFHLTKEHY